MWVVLHNYFDLEDHSSSHISQNKFNREDGGEPNFYKKVIPSNV